MINYYTKEGTEVITNQVARCIEKALGILTKVLDYDELFNKKDDVLGY